MYKITREMENLVLQILVLKQLLENKEISNRLKLENDLNELINSLIVEFKEKNKDII